MHRTPAVIALVLSVWALAACGSSGSTTLDRSALAAKANAICDTYAAKVNALKTPTNQVELAIWSQDAHAVLQQMHAKLAALTPDAKTRQSWDAFVAVEQQITDTAGQIEAKAKALDRAGTQRAFAQYEALGRKRDAASAPLGISCN